MLFHLLLLLPLLIHTQSYHRLSTLAQKTLKPGNFVYSTLGYFRLSLEPSSCQFRIDFFDENAPQLIYKPNGTFPRLASPPCDFLTLNQSGLFTSTGRDFFLFRNQLSKNLTQQDFAKNVKQTFLTIDDTGVIRLESIFADQSTRQKWITNFRIPQKFVTASNNKIILQSSSLSILRNDGDWGFSASKSEFRIFFAKDLNRIARYRFLPFILSTNVFKDSNDFITPLLNFEGLKYERRCGISRQVMFRSPFVFVLNRFWPELRVLDQEGYEIFSMRYPTVNCIRDIGVDKLAQSQQCISWFCPPETFELNGRCLTLCPEPYFHQIKGNDKNRCVLICEAGSQINNFTRRCTCSEGLDIECPFNMTSTPFGCLCTNGRFFLNTKSVLNFKDRPLNEICLRSCPNKYFAHPDGICMSCPVFCMRCTATNSSFTFLRCTECEEGFQVFGMYCRKKCSEKVGNYLNPVNLNCEQCRITNCKKCTFTDQVQRCEQCFLPFVLSNNNCSSNIDINIGSCPRGSLLNFVNDSYFACEEISQCSSLSQSGKGGQSGQCKNCGNKDFCFESCDDSSYNFFHNRSSCFCLQGQTTSYVLGCNYSPNDPTRQTINNTNYLQQDPCSVLLNYFDYRTNECIKCPFGCLTCILSEKGFPECTSCVQNYYLSVYDSNYCQRETSLVYCYNFNRVQKYCFTWDNIVSQLQKDKFHWLCKKQNPYCFICMYKSAVYCRFCSNGYYLHQGKCVQNCPHDFYPYKYQQVCLPKVIANCVEESVEAVNFLVNSGQSTQFTDGYRYLTMRYFTQIQHENDPIGLIFVYYSYLKRRIEGQRMSTFTYAHPVCVTCQQGYGITSAGQCQKCPSFCQRCIFSFLSSCIRCHPFYYLSDSRQCFAHSLEDRPCLNRGFRAQNNICQESCTQFKRMTSNQLFLNQNQKIINCTSNCPDSMLAMKSSRGDVFCVQKNMETENLNNLAVNFGLEKGDLQEIKGDQIKFLASCYKSQAAFCVLIPNTKITFSINEDTIKAEQLLDARLLAQGSSNPYISFQNNILVLKGLNQGLTKITLPVSQFSNPQENRYLGNSVYGIMVEEGNTMLDQILEKGRGMHNYARTLIILFLLIAVINLGKNLDYKLDNTFITMAVVYLVLTSSDLTLSKNSYFLYAWMYGFSWALGLEMFSNPRILTGSVTFFDNSFLQNPQNNAHLLLFVDDNLIRNCWSVLLLIFVMLGLAALIWTMIKLLTKDILCKGKRPRSQSQTEEGESNQVFKNSDSSSSDQNAKIAIKEPIEKRCFKVYQNADVNHFAKFRMFACFVIENCMLALVYYSLLQVTSPEWKLASNSQLLKFKIVAYAFLILAGVYSAIRAWNNFIAGIYMFKRLLIALAIFLNPLSHGGVSLFLSLLVVELVFTGFRVLLQCRLQVFKLKQFMKKKVAEKSAAHNNTRPKQKEIDSPDKKASEKSDMRKTDQVFQFQKGLITGNLLTVPQDSQMDKHKQKATESVNMAHGLKEQQPKEPSIWHEMSWEIKMVLIEETLILVVYLMASLSSLMPELSVFIMFSVLMVFLVAFMDELMVNMIEYVQMRAKKVTLRGNSLISELNNKLTMQKQKYYFKIRNNFDYENQTRSSLHVDSSSILQREKRSSISSIYVQSIA